MMKYLQLLLLSTLLLPAVTGCSRQQLTTADRLFGQGRQLGEKLDQAAHDPLVPEPVAIGLEAGGIVLIGAYGIWQRIRASKLLERKQTVTVTLASLVKAIELLKQTDPELAQLLTAKIAGQMAKGSPENQIIDEIKAQLAGKIS